MFSLSFATTSSCQGYGARFEQRVNSLPPSITSAPSAEHKAAYSSFVTTTLQGFSGASLIQSSNRQAFAAEAEHWVQRAFTSSPSSLMVRTSEALLNSTNESSASKALKTNGSTAHSEAAPLELTLTSVARPALSCLSHLYQLLVGKVDMRPQSFIAEPQSGGAPQNGLILLSGGDRVAALSEAVVENHRQFARTHGYVHWFHKGSMVASLGWLPYWHKIAHVRAAFQRFPSASGYAWIDDDVVLTNRRCEDMIARALRESNRSVLVTRDPAARASGVALNTGIVLLRNDANARRAIEELWRRATAARADGLSLATDPQSRGVLHEQQALQEMLESSSYWRQRVGILEQRDMKTRGDAPSADALAGKLVEGGEGRPVPRQPRWNLNTFLRWSHYHSERSEQMRFDMDAVGSSWQVGDFAGHCSGLSPVRRSLCLSVLLGATVA